MNTGPTRGATIETDPITDFETMVRRLKASIIIPVKNDARLLEQTLKALRPQLEQLPNTEVIVVDNGSSDETESVAKAHDDVYFLQELSHDSSPYSARNLGVVNAIGDVLIFLDASCVPSESWLITGLRAMVENDCDLLGGNVVFTYSARPSLGEIVDSIKNIQNERTITRFGFAATANLFVKREVFETLGPFPSAIRSGGDVRWTKLASSQGYLISYCPQAIVHKPARGFSQLVRKERRTSQGSVAIGNDSGRHAPMIRNKLTRCLLPFDPIRAFRKLSEVQPGKAPMLILPVMATLWYLRAVSLISYLRELARQRASTR
ncbi:glycosyltransferase family A protein [Pelagicoccus sp. SDUM812003]|uniref:glycosyltransferase n=1 Tax=Pelagicoccus sp. SDUM812003 TaxID=3041267 RepID=UPI00280D2926|nr:glycosyltransferase family A protein [Pelagicoccus sp. SDUM812003]MDQ8204657.1 glycosyltransferase family A protein [Pelagicoccus sp. SDUM812003]